MANMNTTSDTIPVRRFPTKLHIRCPQCAHQGFVEAFLDKLPKLYCSKCGNKAPIITSRDQTRTWSARRRGR
jgi:uncharacterized protein (DUF983 family)